MHELSISLCSRCWCMNRHLCGSHLNLRRLRIPKSSQKLQQQIGKACSDAELHVETWVNGETHCRKMRPSTVLSCLTKLAWDALSPAFANRLCACRLGNSLPWLHNELSCFVCVQSGSSMLFSSLAVRLAIILPPCSRVHLAHRHSRLSVCASFIVPFCSFHWILDMLLLLLLHVWAPLGAVCPPAVTPRG
jgi:hypothetical protein